MPLWLRMILLNRKKSEAQDPGCRGGDHLGVGCMEKVYDQIAPVHRRAIMLDEESVPPPQL